MQVHPHGRSQIHTPFSFKFRYSNNSRPRLVAKPKTQKILVAAATIPARTLTPKLGTKQLNLNMVAPGFSFLPSNILCPPLYFDEIVKVH